MTQSHDHQHVAAEQLAGSTDCSEALLRVYEYLDGEMGEGDVAKIKIHLDECTACLKQYHLDEALKAVIKRSCSSEAAPVELRASILQRITMIRYTTGD
ncbi:mycothiol system anti-sigma-R factor [Dermatophilaceae bacterium Soc4.6]